MSDIEETQATEERPQIKMFFEAESADHAKRRQNQIRERYDKSPEKLFQIRWHDRAVRQEIWLAAKKFWDDRTTNRDKVQDVAIAVAERCAVEHRSSLPQQITERDGVTRLSNIEREYYRQCVTSGGFAARYQFWCFLEMLAFGVTPSDLQIIWKDTEKCARVQSSRMEEFMNSLPHGMTETSEHKAQRMKIQNFDDENPVISENLLSGIWRWTKLYLEAGYPQHYVTARRNTLYLTKPHNPDVTVVSENDETWHSLKYYLYYGITRLADAAKPKPRYKPSYLGRVTDYFSISAVPELESMYSLLPGRGVGVTEQSHPYLWSVADTFYKRASVSGKIRIHAAIESMFMLRSVHKEEVMESFITMVETSCFGKELTKGRGYARRAFWSAVCNSSTYPTDLTGNPCRRPTDEIVHASAVDMIMRAADPRQYCALHLHGRGGLSAPITHEEYVALPTGEREFYQQIFMIMLMNDPTNSNRSPI